MLFYIHVVYRDWLSFAHVALNATKHTTKAVTSSQGFIWRFYLGGGGGNMVDNFKDSKKGHNTPVAAFATSQL